VNGRHYLTYFSELGLADPILRAIDATGYNQPTPIQQDVIPILNAGKDVIGIAQTGTGKTAAFVLPILNRIAANNIKQAPKTCGALILAPTRELAQQIAESVKTYSKYLNVRSTVIVGGVKPGPQIKACARGVDIIVATPGRLLDHLGTGAIRLDKTFQVVADEADHMMDMGFIPAIRKIMQALPKKRQTILLSATMPTQIRKLAKDFMHKPEEVSVAAVSKPIERITQTIKLIDKGEKKRALATLLADKDITRAVVFTRTKHGANKVADYLVKNGQTALAIHGNKSQSQRERSLASFKAGTTKILVATDIAARGIDIEGVSHVVNFELPNVPESYVHRIGRTARAGRSGVAVSLVDTSEIKLLRDIEKLTGQNLLSKDIATPAEEKGNGRKTSNRRSTNPNKRRSKGRNANQKPGGQRANNNANKSANSNTNKSADKNANDNAQDKSNSSRPNSRPNKQAGGQEAKQGGKQANKNGNNQNRKRRNKRGAGKPRQDNSQDNSTDGLMRVLGGNKPLTARRPQ
jgi:ATP-dependent RNA helicase RhlE